MYSPYLNQFIQPDTIVPDPRIPADWNKYTYVRNNPINYTDPSGYEACSQNYDYCKIIDGPYEGFFVDIRHWQDGNSRSQDINDKLRRVKGKFVGQFGEYEDLADIFLYSRTYFTNIPENISEALLDEITLGILVDYEVGLESMEGWDPACFQKDWTTDWPKKNHLCSSFSNEDLPSIYPGYVAYKKGWSLKEVASKFVENVEEATEGTDNFPRGIVERFAKARNYYLTPKLLDEITNQYKNFSWPSGIPIYSINEPGTYWWPDYMVGY